MKEYERLHQKSIMKYDDCVNNRPNINISLKNKNIDTFYNKLFYNIGQINDACELIIKSICEIFKIKYEGNHYAYKLYDEKLSDKIKINNNSKRIFKEINILYNSESELKKSNKIHKSIYYNINSKKSPYNVINLDSLDIMINIYNHFNNFYYKNISKNSQYLELVFNELTKAQNIINDESLKEEKYLDIDKCFKLIIENLLNFILQFKKVDKFENLNVYQKILKCFEICDEDILRYKNLLSNIFSDDLINYINDINLNNILNNLREFYNFCENLEFE